MKRTKAKPIDLKDVTLDLVKGSTFGCRNCLYNSCECKGYSKFVPEVYEGKPTCEAYTYYD